MFAHFLHSDVEIPGDSRIATWLTDLEVLAKYARSFYNKSLAELTESQKKDIVTTLKSDKEVLRIGNERKYRLYDEKSPVSNYDMVAAAIYGYGMFKGKALLNESDSPEQQLAFVNHFVQVRDRVRLIQQEFLRNNKPIRDFNSPFFRYGGYQMTKEEIAQEEVARKYAMRIYRILSEFKNKPQIDITDKAVFKGFADINDYEEIKFSLLLQKTYQYLMDEDADYKFSDKFITTNKDNLKDYMQNPFFKIAYNTCFGSHGEKVINKIIDGTVESYVSIFLLLLMAGIDEKYYENEIDNIVKLADSLKFTEFMLHDWIIAVKYNLDGNEFSKTMPVSFKTKEANSLFKRQF